MTQSPLHAAERSLLGDIMTSDTLWSSLLVLCDDCNGRFVGSDDEQRAAAFIRQSFEQYGLSNARIEEFPLRGWRRGPASLTVNGHELDCIGLPGTPPCDLSAPAIFLGDGEPADFEKAGEAPTGKIALVRGKGSHRLEKYARAVKAGCVGFVFSGAEPNALPPTGSLEFNGEPAPIPGVGIAYETLCRLERTAARGDVTAHLRVQAEVFDAISHNVIADLIPPAMESPDWLMMCAHYDGHDIAQGAVDNASGTVAVLEAAKALKVAYDRLAAQGAAPALGIRFALWSGEEVGMLGSSHYAAKHAGELSRIRLVFNCDIVGNPGTLFLGINGHDTDRLVAYFKGLADNQLFDIQAGNSIVIPYSDHFSFYLKGVPALMAATGGGKSPGPHTHGDTLDKVDVRAVRSATVFAARALLRLACNPAPLPARHATTEEVQDVLRKAGYEDLLKAQRRWKF